MGTRPTWGRSPSRDAETPLCRKNTVANLPQGTAPAVVITINNFAANVIVRDDENSDESDQYYSSSLNKYQMVYNNKLLFRFQFFFNKTPFVFVRFLFFMTTPTYP